MRSRIEGNNLFLPSQLPREEYDRVAKAITAAGGKWNRKAGCHVFPGDVRQTLDIRENSLEVVNVQQTFQAFNTPPEVARMVALWAGVESGHRLLEPSAGTGRLLEAIYLDHTPRVIVFATDTIQAVAVEIDPVKAEVLRARFPLAGVVVGDFLAIRDLGTFDRIVMNPPFSNGGAGSTVRPMARPGARGLRQ